MSEHSAEKDAAERVLAEHREAHWCCHADRAPCVLKDGDARCWTATCRKCAPSPRDSTAPVWPCDPVRLALAATRVLPPGVGQR